MADSAAPVIVPSIYSGGNPYGNGYGNGYYLPAYLSQQYSQNQQNQQQGGGGNGGFSFSNFPTSNPFGNSFGGLSNSINNFGASAFGLPTIGGATEPISYGLAAADPSLLSSGAGSLGGSLTGVLGAGGLGFLGGGLLAGLTGGNQMGGSIGGGLGAGIGMAIGGPPGALLGGLLGGIGGGLFGGKKKPATSLYQTNMTFNPDGTVAQGSTGGKNGASQAGAVGNVTQGLTGAFQKVQPMFTKLGLKFDPTEVNYGVNTLHSPSGQPGFIFVSADPKNRGADQSIDAAIGYDPSDRASVNNAIQRAITQIATQSGATPDQLKQIMATLNAPTSVGAIQGASANAPIVAAQTGPQQTTFQQFLQAHLAATNVNSVPGTPPHG